jgi:cytidine deaminase
MSTKIESASSEIRELYKHALLGREKAYCPYSGYKVGAAIRTSSGQIFSGCNVENSSFGATVCAERVAIQKAVSEKGQLEILEVMVVTDSTPPWPPCGMCRQVIAEFGTNVTIHIANLEGDFSSMSFGELFPKAFSPEHLIKS